MKDKLIIRRLEEILGVQEENIVKTLKKMKKEI